MEEKNRKTGIDIVGDTPWGTHLCIFYQSKEDLIDILVPYFKAGLENNEFCMWVTSEPLKTEEAKSSLGKAIKNLDDYIKKGQIEILDYGQWYTKSGKFEADKILQGWVEKKAQALKMGFDGLRLTGNTSWLEKNDWKKFADYEATINNVIGKYRIIAICSYSLDKCNAGEIIEVVNNHQFALIKREDNWMILESSERKKAEDVLRQSEERHRKQFEEAIDAIFLADPETGMIVGCNIAATKLIEREKSEIIGKHQSFLHPAEDIINGVSKTFKRHVIGEASELLEDKVVTQSGQIKDVAIRASRITIEGKEILQGIFRDITECKKAELELQEQKLALEQKNLALMEMIEHIERAKNKTKDDIAINVNEFLLPILKKLKLRGAPAKYINLIQRHLEELTSSFGRKITEKSIKLTSREIEICNMVKGGLTSKEIAELLNISQQTIDKHRKNIRYKLNLSKKGVNLSSFLHKL